MGEDLLHFVWKYRMLQLQELATDQNEPLVIVDVGSHNHRSGPDFFNAKVRIDGQLWAGNVEVHVNASDWYAHRHEEDANYDNIILHVVWHDDMAIYRRDRTKIPTLELKKYIPKDILVNYRRLFDKRSTKFINCENDISSLDAFTMKNWIERLYIERLEQKSVFIQSLLEDSKNDWEKVAFMLLLKNFGLNINGQSFLSIAQTLDFSIVRKLQDKKHQLESVLFGLGGLLDHKDTMDGYLVSLRHEYTYLSTKFDLVQDGVQRPEFFRLRPSNFPTIRLSQIANLYERHRNLFQKLMNADNLEELYTVFEISASRYWDDHFTFGKKSRKSTKKLTRPFIDLLIINTVLPLRFCYDRHRGKDAVAVIFRIMGNIKKEDNAVLKKFDTLGLEMGTAFDSQAVLQLYNSYCTKNKCLQCAIGSGLLQGNI
ncbi:MAG: hypothetical protein CR994_08925 [Maribacter sp.]|nr:MAG: hypothetical protein CR994_08925 [Maribacter sp.]